MNPENWTLTRSRWMELGCRTSACSVHFILRIFLYIMIKLASPALTDSWNQGWMHGYYYQHLFSFYNCLASPWKLLPLFLLLLTRLPTSMSLTPFRPGNTSSASAPTCWSCSPHVQGNDHFGPLFLLQCGGHHEEHISHGIWIHL